MWFEAKDWLDHNQRARQESEDGNFLRQTLATH